MSRVLATRLFGAALALATAAAAGGQEKGKAPDYYPLAKGTKWVYREIINGKEVGDRPFYVWKVTVKGGKTTATVNNSVGIDHGTATIIADEKGVYHETLDGVLPLLKYPVKMGDKWAVRFKAVPPQAADRIFTTRVAGEIEVTVPAGKFTAVEVRTVEVRVWASEGTTLKRIKESVWYAPGVGIVKRVITWENPADGTIEFEHTYELKKFTPAK